MATDAVRRVIEHLQSNPGVAGFAGPVSVRLVSSDLRKRSSEFHRVLVRHRQGVTPCWIKIVKNKPREDIHRSLSRQHRVMRELWAHFSERPGGDPLLGTCKPLALLLEFDALVTRECRGELMNRVLVRSIPWFHRRRILEYCRGAGVWLRRFHEYYRNGGPSEDAGGFPTLCHTDYSPRNIFVSPGLVEVIDFVGVKEGRSGADVAFFLDYIRDARFNGLYWQGIKREMARAFLEGYGDAGPTAAGTAQPAGSSRAAGPTAREPGPRGRV